MRCIRGLGAVVIAAAGVFATLGCAGNEYSLDDGVRDLQRDAGLSESEAECVIDGLEGRIGPDELRGFSEATSGQRELVAALMEECAGEGAGAPAEGDG